MANYSELLNDINAAIYENNDQEIDALEVRAILREMVTSLGSGFLFKGIATPSSPSGTGTYEPDQNVFYLATTAGTYTYLGGLVVAAGEVAFLCFDGTWTKKSSALLSTGSIVDNTTTDDATKPLSAKQGKVLADSGAATAAEVSALGQEVDEKADQADLSQLEAKVDEKFRVVVAPMAVNSTSGGWKLLANGLCAQDSTARIQKYLVTAGAVIYLKLSADTEGVYQFQSAASVPSSGTNTNLVGTTVTTATDAYVEVPTGATYLIISELKTNDSNEVKSTKETSASEIENQVLSLGNDVAELDDVVKSGDVLPFNRYNKKVQLTDNRTNGGDFPLYAGNIYRIKATISESVATYIDVGLRIVGGDSNLASGSIDAGSLSVEFLYVPGADAGHCCFSIYSSSYSTIGTIDVSIDCLKVIENVMPGMGAVSPSANAVSSFVEKAGKYLLTERTDGVVGNSYELRPDGYSVYNDLAKLVKFEVTPGQLVKLSLQKDTKSVYQFQNGSNVPSSGTRNLVGVPVPFSTDGIVVVPEGATHLIVSMLKTNTTSKVYAVSNAIDGLEGTFKGVFDFGTGSIAKYGRRLLLYNIISGHKYYVKIITENNTERTFFSTRTDPETTVDNGLGAGVGSRDFEFTASGNAAYIALSYSDAGLGAEYQVEITDRDVPSIYKNHLDIEDLQGEVEEIKNARGEFIVLPDYAKEEQERVLGILMQRISASVHIAAFNTDQHFDLDFAQAGWNPKYVMQGVQALINIANDLPIDQIVFGGDVAGYGGNSSSDAIGILKTVNHLLEPTKDANTVIVSIPGNHDAWQNNGDVTAQGMYNVNAKRNQRHTYFVGNGTDNCDAYVDDTEHKIRSIYIDTFSTNVRTENYRTFLTNALSTLPEGYMALVFSHNPLTNEFAGTVLAQKISDPSIEINAFQDPSDCHEILNQFASKIIACICGHTHFDASAVSSSGILYIETTTAAPHSRNYTTYDIPNTSTPNTVTDTSFDFFVIDQGAKTIEAVRYGEGCNRKWKYKGDDAGMLPGYPQTIVRN